MASNQVPFNLTKGQSYHNPPYFNGTNYSYQKETMRIFIQATDDKLWKIIMNEPEIPTNLTLEGQVIPKEDGESTKKENEKVESNEKAINMMHCAINFEEYKKYPDANLLRKYGRNFNSLMKEQIK
ncbi:hypothetical protein AHAS_Ahas07G0095800 [Arachis hypogaea]